MFASTCTIATATNTSQVQQVLTKLQKKQPTKVGKIAETNRLYLKARPGQISDWWLQRIQKAFVADVATYCKYYGWKYLIDWKLLLSKSARETYWGTSYLCNRANNYFGIRSTLKPWACTTFSFCDTIVRNDPKPSPFLLFENFEESLWMFVHTIYSDHYLERLPDKGERVKAAIEHERKFGLHYWKATSKRPYFAKRLEGNLYKTNAILATWSGHEAFNLCVNCSTETDLVWIKELESILK